MQFDELKPSELSYSESSIEMEAAKLFDSYRTLNKLGDIPLRLEVKVVKVEDEEQQIVLLNGVESEVLFREVFKEDDYSEEELAAGAIELTGLFIEFEEYF
jgi:hypothetical protein